MEHSKETGMRSLTIFQIVKTNAIAVSCHVSIPMEHAEVVGAIRDGEDPVAVREVSVIQALGI